MNEPLMSPTFLGAKSPTVETLLQNSPLVGHQSPVIRNQTKDANMTFSCTPAASKNTIMIPQSASSSEQKSIDVSSESGEIMTTAEVDESISDNKSPQKEQIVSPNETGSKSDTQITRGGGGTLAAASALLMMK